MDSKEYLTNKSFCPIPWTGFMYNSNGDVMNCIRSQLPIGNLNQLALTEILDNNNKIKHDMRARQAGAGCDACYKLEADKNSFDIISDRVFYLKELKDVNANLYDTDNFRLHQIDIRWSNVCNFACVYCGPEYSSRIATELNVAIQQPSMERIAELKNYVFENASQLKHVYLAGGEPLLMKENLELLELLRTQNPNVNLRVNTNLSKVDTRVFETICKFPNVHWTISVESIENEYEYIRYGGSWRDFTDNLTTIQQLDHKISFNMLHFILNYKSIFDCITFLQTKGFHNNSFIVGALAQPNYLDIRHLPKSMLDSVEQELANWINQKPGFLLENGLRNMLQYIKTPMEKNIDYCLTEIAGIDQRRNLNSRAIFTELYNLLERQ